ncbi:hypothetical protein [Bradyrhizobium sp. WSM3983]|uniref:hypothetical protein n=1 Tax=Bradyrhizobium sp. WSM3983 TaxID=1038867 RepID=UPI0012EB5EA4|nr:hypothetical protein [Bradyrhizobium sp. WSM3983]
MMIDCAALVTELSERKQHEIELGFICYREASSRRVGDRADANYSGYFGNQSTGTLQSCRKARAIRASQDRQPKPKHVSGCVAKQRDHRAWFARTKNRSAEFHLR